MHDLRSQFPVLERLAYLNAGTNGPVPRRAIEAVEASLRRQLDEGRSSSAFFEEMAGRGDELRFRVARLIGAQDGEVALTGSTTDGVNSVLHALDLAPGDELLTSDEEHPGVLAPLAAARARGMRVRQAPFADLAAAVGPDTRAVVCSHVSWITGRLVDSAALAASGVLVLLDGAQGLGAVPVDVGALGCDFYAASGQKWLCGPNGIGYVYARADRVSGLRAPWPGWQVLEDPHEPLESPLHPDARRLATGFPAHHQVQWAHAALDVLEEPGIDRVQARAIELAAGLAERLADGGLEVAPRGRSTLVSFAVDDPQSMLERVLAAGFVLRDLPGTSYLRASVGGWTTDDELDRLAGVVTD
jgi:selenocysteine lyase/cysteine desulfurase